MTINFGLPVSSDRCDAAIAEAIDLCRAAEPALARDLEALIGLEERKGEIAGHDVEHECIVTALKILVVVAMEIDDGRLGAVLACIRYLAGASKAVAQRRDTFH